MIALLTLAFAAPQCLTQYEKTACGYHCLANHGQVACARTPDGICSDGAETVTCWDPPEAVRLHYRGRVPRPACLSRAGKTACGYACQAHDNEVVCAETP